MARRGLANRLGELGGTGVPEDMEGEAFGRTATDAGEALEGVDQALEGLRVRHGVWSSS